MRRDKQFGWYTVGHDGSGKLRIFKGIRPKGVNTIKTCNSLEDAVMAMDKWEKDNECQT